MKITNRQARLCRVLVGALLGGWLLGVGLLSLTRDAAAALPPRPSRPSQEKSHPEPPPGAHISLRAPAAPPGIWTVVQWQDRAGDWHDVEGWRGKLDTTGQKMWWVAHKDFGAGPFRWALYASQGGPLLTASDPFYLPSQAHQMASIVVSLGARPSAVSGQPAPTASSRVSALLPTTGAPGADAWLSIILVLGLVIGGGLLLNRPKRRR